MLSTLDHTYILPQRKINYNSIPNNFIGNTVFISSHAISYLQSSCQCRGLSRRFANLFRNYGKIERATNNKYHANYLYINVYMYICAKTPPPCLPILVGKIIHFDSENLPDCMDCPLYSDYDSANFPVNWFAVYHIAPLCCKMMHCPMV